MFGKLGAGNGYRAVFLVKEPLKLGPTATATFRCEPKIFRK
jgi:hypothetical protein